MGRLILILIAVLLHTASYLILVLAMDATEMFSKAWEMSSLMRHSLYAISFSTVGTAVAFIYNSNHMTVKVAVGLVLFSIVPFVLIVIFNITDLIVEAKAS